MEPIIVDDHVQLLEELVRVFQMDHVVLLLQHVILRVMEPIIVETHVQDLGEHVQYQSMVNVVAEYLAVVQEDLDLPAQCQMIAILEDVIMLGVVMELMDDHQHHVVIGSVVLLQMSSS